MIPTAADTGVVSGQNTGWTLVRKLGEGDAGEVYLVESILENQLAILKRPARSVFTGEVRRQAEQIRTEGRILKALGELLAHQPNPRIHTPALLDQSKSGSEFGERYFIVIDHAPGFDLNLLARVGRLGLDDDLEVASGSVEQTFLREIAAQNAVPERTILACLSAVLSIFETIHTTPVDTGTGDAAGIIWNDVKPDHLFWDPFQTRVTVIDWGNGRFLEEGGMTRDMRHTAAGDRRQFLDEMGNFLAQAAPDLHKKLKWPDAGHLYEDVQPLIEPLRGRIESALAKAERQLKKARSREVELLDPSLETGLDLPGLEAVHREIVSLGEIPDYPAALRLVARSASNLAAAGDMGGVRELSAWAAGLPAAPVESLQLMAHLAQIAAEERGPAYASLVSAVQQAAAGDWREALWQLLASMQNGSEPDWWNDLLPQVRKLASLDELTQSRPLLELRRIYLTLQSQAQALEDRLARQENGESQAHLEVLVALTGRIRAVISNWVQLEPLPPDSTLAYSDLDPLINEIEMQLAGAGATLRRALAPARRQVAAVMETWGRKEFVDAGVDLRHLLVLDPDRRRLLRAAEALQAAPDWIQRLHTGPLPGESLLDFVTTLEYEGRDLRNQVGPASWLDSSLEGLKAMRRGVWPGDLFEQQPALINEIPWLKRFERVERVQQILHPDLPVLTPLAVIEGVREARFGPETELAFTEPLDAWLPEARGSSARVYLGSYRGGSGEQRETAIKVMRMDKTDYALPLFREEVQVLQVMQDVMGVSRMLECGFLWMGETPELPPDHNLGAIQALRGDALRIGPDSSAHFLAELEQRVREGWTPYLLVELRRRDDNLLMLCDASLNRGRFLPVPKLLLMCIQICSVLAEAHRRNVVYRDHKLLHYYWLEEYNGVSVIDWNVARYHPEGPRPVDIHMDLVQLGARGLHHILTGRTAPGALPLGPTRPEEIEQAAQSYKAQWTFDDQRLSQQVRVILEQCLAGSYLSAEDLRDDLKRAYMELG